MWTRVSAPVPLGNKITGRTKLCEIIKETGPRVPNMHRHLPDPEPLPSAARPRRVQGELGARVVDIDAPLLELEMFKGKLVRDDLLSLLVSVLVKLGMHLVRRRPHPVDLSDAFGKGHGRVMPLRGLAPSEYHKMGEETEEAL